MAALAPKDFHDANVQEVQVRAGAVETQDGHLLAERKDSGHIFIENYEPSQTKEKRALSDMFLLRRVTKNGQNSFHVHFLPEGLRFIAYLGFGIVMTGGAILYRATESSLTPIENTYIYKTFGFAHPCVIIDEGAPKAWATMLIPLWEYPLILYLLTSTLRIYDDWKEAKKGVSHKVMLYSLIVLPFNVLSTIMFRQVFVWGPGDTGETFPAHYGFYIWFQLALVLDITKNIVYLDCLKHLPFKNNRGLAYTYLVLLCMTTFLYIVLGVSAAAGTPIFGWNQHSAAISFVHALSVLYFIFAVPMPTFLAWYGVVYGDNRYITFAMS